MFTYQVRERIFRLEKEKELSWPADVQVRFHLLPLQPFGMEAGGGRTAIQNVPATSFFNANSGAHTIESASPLKPLRVAIEEPTRTVLLHGNVLSLKESFGSLGALQETIEALYFGLPLLLNLGFGDPPIVERVDGSIGATSFRWELARWWMEFKITTQEDQENLAAGAWRSFNVITGPGRRRLVAALHYFHVACRLSRRGQIPGEFLPEILLSPP